jgi:hypothetical protein
MEEELQRNRRSLYEEQVSILPRWFTGEMLLFTCIFCGNWCLRRRAAHKGFEVVHGEGAKYGRIK